MTDGAKGTTVALGIYAAYAALVAAANILMSRSGGGDLWEAASGILLGFVAIPVFSIILPIALARRRSLDASFWPRTKPLPLVLAVFAIYLLICGYEPLKVVLRSPPGLRDFAVHFVSAMLFHVSYYPLFALLLLPSLRRSVGLGAAVPLTALLFALYHLAQFHFFPAGTGFGFQLLLFASFCASLALYLWSESLILTTLAHSVNGALGLAANGTLFAEIDFVFFLTIVIVGGLYAYMAFRAVKARESTDFRAAFWITAATER